MPIALTESDYPMAEGLDKLFPTLIERGMKYFELKSDAENGALAKSENPTNVSKLLIIV